MAIGVSCEGRLLSEEMIDPTEDEISFLQKVALRGGELTLQGNMSLLKIDRLIPEYVALVNTGRETGASPSPKRAGNLRGNIRGTEAGGRRAAA
jgi:hypothetical protein